MTKTQINEMAILYAEALIEYVENDGSNAAHRLITSLQNELFAACKQYAAAKERELSDALVA